MIVVKVELHSAITGQQSEIARMVIDNIGGDETRGDYRCRTYRGRDERSLTLAMLRNNTTREARVHGHRRLALHVWHLVAKALIALEYGNK